MIIPLLECQWTTLRTTLTQTVVPYLNNIILLFGRNLVNFNLIRNLIFLKIKTQSTYFLCLIIIWVQKYLYFLYHHIIKLKTLKDKVYKAVINAAVL